MPVIDHGQHGSTAKESATHRYGCWNRPVLFEPVMWLQDGWLPAVIDGEPTRLSRMIDVEFRMSDSCRYDRSESDPACSDCKHLGAGARYTAEQEAKGAK